MVQQSTPIENIVDRNPNNGPAINETNLSTAQQILQKYNEMEAGDADVQRQQVNGNMQHRQMDPSMQQQQRLAELEKVQQQQQLQQQEQHVQSENNNILNNTSGSIMDKLNMVIQKSQAKLKDVVVVVFLFIALNMGIVNKLLLQYVPFLGNEGSLTMNGIIAKGLIAGVVFYVVSTLLLIL
jgi:hypothetical protein